MGRITTFLGEHRIVIAKLTTFLLALAVAGGAVAQDKKRIEKAADMPRFTYKVDAKLDAIVRDDAKHISARSTECRARHDFSIRWNRRRKPPWLPGREIRSGV